MTTTSRLPVRHNQRLTHEQLLLEAQKAFELSGLTRQKLGERLECTGAAIGQALSRAGGRYASLQQRIIAELTGYTVEPLPQEYLVTRKEGADT